MAVITIRGENGTGEAIVNDWDQLSPAYKVLAIHEARRDITGGRPFEITAVKQSLTTHQSQEGRR